MNGYIMSRSGEIEVFEVLDTIAIVMKIVELYESSVGGGRSCWFSAGRGRGSGMGGS